MKKKWIRDFLVISLGCLMIGVAFNGFFDRYGMAPGGLSGLFVIINHILHIDPQSLQNALAPRFSDIKIISIGDIPEIDVPRNP